MYALPARGGFSAGAVSIAQAVCLWLLWAIVLAFAFWELGALVIGIYLIGSGLAAIAAHKSK